MIIIIAVIVNILSFFEPPEFDGRDLEANLPMDKKNGKSCKKKMFVHANKVGRHQ